jgi:hypothetical protein
MCWRRNHHGADTRRWCIEASEPASDQGGGVTSWCNLTRSRRRPDPRRTVRARSMSCPALIGTPSRLIGPADRGGGASSACRTVRRSTAQAVIFGDMDDMKPALMERPSCSVASVACFREIGIEEYSRRGTAWRSAATVHGGAVHRSRRSIPRSHGGGALAFAGNAAREVTCRPAGGDEALHGRCDVTTASIDIDTSAGWRRHSDKLGLLFRAQPAIVCGDSVVASGSAAAGPTA